MRVVLPLAWGSSHLEFGDFVHRSPVRNQNKPPKQYYHLGGFQTQSSS